MTNASNRVQSRSQDTGGKLERPPDESTVGFETSWGVGQWPSIDTVKMGDRFPNPSTDCADAKRLMAGRSLLKPATPDASVPAQREIIIMIKSNANAWVHDVHTRHCAFHRHEADAEAIVVHKKKSGVRFNSTHLMTTSSQCPPTLRRPPSSPPFFYLACTEQACLRRSEICSAGQQVTAGSCFRK